MSKMFSLFFLLFVFSNTVAIDIICGTMERECDPNSKIRTYDGSCNNIFHPTWGSASARYARLLSSNYSDGVSSYRKARDGKPLPNPRWISMKLYNDKLNEDPKLTLNAMQFGELFAHDLGNRLVVDSDQCCYNFKYKKGVNKDLCNSIPIPFNDTVYSKIAGECLPYKRSATNHDLKCSKLYVQAEQLNQYTGYLDLHPIYGTNKKEARALRLRRFGKLRVNRINEQDWFLNSANPSKDCESKSSPPYCFRSGDSRINRNPQLALLNVVLLREHNRIALKLCGMNHNWSEEQTFQTARSILIGMFQHIVFTELLPMYIDKTVLTTNRILFETDGFVEEYDPEVHGGPLNEFSHAAFRYGHSMVAGHLKFSCSCRKMKPGVALEDTFYNISILQEGDNFEFLTRGLTMQRSQASDRSHTPAITKYLMKGEMELGQDLRSVDIQRGRDHGLRSYNDYRPVCNRRKAQYFWDFLDVMDFEDTFLLQELYDHPDDVDLLVGGSLETIGSGELVGPTLTCIWLKQFQNIRKGDRLFYDHKDGPFTLEQLKEIRKATVSKLYCNNVKNMKKIQPRGFLVVRNTNEVVSCEELPDLNLTKWKE